MIGLAIRLALTGVFSCIVASCLADEKILDTRDGSRSDKVLYGIFIGGLCVIASAILVLIWTVGR